MYKVWQCLIHEKGAPAESSDVAKRSRSANSSKLPKTLETPFFVGWQQQCQSRIPSLDGEYTGNTETVSRPDS